MTAGSNASTPPTSPGAPGASGATPPAAKAPMPSVDALIPKAMLDKAIDIGVTKANLPFIRLAALGVLAGAYISLGGMFMTTVTTGGTNYGVTRLLGGIVFALGLMLVVVGGAELFTGNTLLTMAAADGRVPLRLLGRNWTLVWFTNLIGALATAALVFLARGHESGKGAVGVRMLDIAEFKASGGLLTMFFSGILANALVCLAVWLSYAARSVTDKVIAITLPVAAFVAGGFEHCVANMYLLPVGWLVKQFAPDSFWEHAGVDAAMFPHIGAQGILSNLLMATLGNIVGGGLLVGVVYWFAYGVSHHHTGAKP